MWLQFVVHLRLNEIFHFSIQQIVRIETSKSPIDNITKWIQNYSKNYHSSWLIVWHLTLMEFQASSILNFSSETHFLITWKMKKLSFPALQTLYEFLIIQIELWDFFKEGPKIIIQYFIVLQVEINIIWHFLFPCCLRPTFDFASHSQKIDRVDFCWLFQFFLCMLCAELL